MRIVSIVGARPQFVKAAIVCRASANSPARLEHLIVHTGQHYDADMSDSFFEQLGLPSPDRHLGVGSGTHGQQTGEMIKRLEPVLAEFAADWVLLYGDTNSTLAGAVVASKLHQKIAHVEAGLRSWNRQMPEEMNRIVADHLSDLLLCPTATAIANLEREGLAHRALLTGDVMYDAILQYRQTAESRASSLPLRWQAGEYALATVHRAENTDHPERLFAILRALDRIATAICPVVLPLHPRTRKLLNESRYQPHAITMTAPVSYLDMILLESRARMILTDSGGVQKEAYFVQVPCITLRDETEWVETLENHCNVLVGAHEERIVESAARTSSAGPWTAVYGTGRAGEAIISALLSPPTTNSDRDPLP
jgi:UDP-GlcNAc3NAcA epimerase